jgi:Fe2+ transport system protein FeoA
MGIVSQFLAGKEFAARLAALGLTIGAELVILQNAGHGPVIISVRDTRLVLGRGEASKIQVEAS